MATIDELRRGINQYESGTGRRISPDVLQALLQAQLEVDAGRQAQNKQLELRERAVESDIKERKSAAEAAKVSGITQLGGTAIAGGQLLKGTALGKSIGSSVSGLFGGGASGSAVPAAAETGGYSLLGGTGAESLVGSSAVSGGGSAAGTTGAGAGTTGAGGAGAGLGTAAGIAAVVAADQMLANKVGQFETPQDRWETNVRGFRYGGVSPGASATIEKAFPFLKDISTNPVEKVAAAGTSGTIPEFLGGSQKGLLPDIEQISSDAGSVICSELCRQGHLPEDVLLLDSKHRDEFIDDKTYSGYLKWAVPVVRVMKKSKLMTQIIRPFGVAWAYEMAHRINPEVKGKFLGKVLLKIGVPICSYLGEKETEYANA